MRYTSKKTAGTRARTSTITVTDVAHSVLPSAGMTTSVTAITLDITRDPRERIEADRVPLLLLPTPGDTRDHHHLLAENPPHLRHAAGDQDHPHLTQPGFLLNL